MQAQDIASRGGSRKRESKFAIEPTRPTQRGVDGVRSIGRRDHHHRPARVETVHEREERRDDGSVYGVALAPPPRFSRGREAVDLVEEDDGGLSSLRLLKQQSERTLRLPHVLPEAVCPLATEEGHGAGSPRRRAEQRLDRGGLSRARRAVKQDASARAHAEPLKRLRIHQRQQREFLERSNLARHPRQRLPPAGKRVRVVRIAAETPTPERTADRDALDLPLILHQPSTLALRKRLLVVILVFRLASHALARGDDSGDNTARSIDLTHLGRPNDALLERGGGVVAAVPTSLRSTGCVRRGRGAAREAIEKRGGARRSRGVPRASRGVRARVVGGGGCCCCEAFVAVHGFGPHGCWCALV